VGLALGVRPDRGGAGGWISLVIPAHKASEAVLRASGIGGHRGCLGDFLGWVGCWLGGTGITEIWWDGGEIRRERRDGKHEETLEKPWRRRARSHGEDAREARRGCRAWTADPRHRAHPGGWGSFDVSLPRQPSSPSRFHSNILDIGHRARSFGAGTQKTQKEGVAYPVIVGGAGEIRSAHPGGFDCAASRRLLNGGPTRYRPPKFPGIQTSCTLRRRTDVALANPCFLFSPWTTEIFLGAGLGFTVAWKLRRRLHGCRSA
jgi:hypothetical protein